MTESRALDRLLAFGDAMVAIAATLLVLPLVDLAQEVGDRPVGPYLRDNYFDLVGFALSFVVIAAFWRVHHGLYETLQTCTPSLVTTNLVWLASIAFLPFPTELLGTTENDTAVYGLYIGTMIVTSAASVAQVSIIKRLLASEGETDSAHTMQAGLVTLGLMVAAFSITLLIKPVGLWSLLLLTLASPIGRILKRWNAPVRAHR